MGVMSYVTANSTTTNFYAFSDANARSFIDCSPQGNVQDIKRFSIPGVDGNLLIRGGFRGAQIALTVRYKGTRTNAIGYYKTDRELFAKYNCIVNDGTQTWSRCTLRADGAQRITPEHSGCFFDVRYIFDVEEL